MSPWYNPLTWGREKTDPMRKQYGLMIGAQEATKSSSEVEYERGLGVDLEIIHDRELEALFENLIYIKAPAVDDNNKIVLDENNNPVYVKVGIDPAMLAIRNINSHLNSLSFYEPKEAEIQRNYNETVLLFAQVGIPEANWSWGTEALFMAIEAAGRRRIAESINGRKIKALKIVKRATAVEVSERTNKKGETFI